MTHPPLFHCSWSKTSGVPLLLHLCFEISHGKHWKTAARPVPVLQSQSFGLQIMGCREVLFPINPSGLSPCFRQWATLLDVVFLMFLIGFWKSFSHWLHWLQKGIERCLAFMFINPHHSSPFLWCIYCLSANWGQVIYFMKQPLAGNLWRLWAWSYGL